MRTARFLLIMTMLGGCSAGGGESNSIGLSPGSGATGPTGTGTGTGSTPAVNVEPTGGQICGLANMIATIRDFKMGTPLDFEYVIQASGKNYVAETGIVAGELDSERKPVYAGDPTNGTGSTTGKANFDTWFRNVEGVNYPANYVLPFESQQVPNPNNPSETITQYVVNKTYSVEPDRGFWPLDKQLWGNEGLTHNFSFTLEFHTKFTYHGYEIFDFEGDDDVWVFFNNRLAVDLGGIHLPLAQQLKLSDIAGDFGLVVGESYNFDFFYAERHTTMSDMKLTTTLSFTDCATY